MRFRRWVLVSAALLIGGAGFAGENEEPKPGQVRLNPKDSLEYVWIPPGTFNMGCVPEDDECEVDESPRHEVTISQGFWMSRTEVTRKAYRRFTRAARRKMLPKPRATPFGRLSTSSFSISDKFDSGPGKKEERPIVNVTWEEAKAFCEHGGGRLPTEAEWEYAARGGEEGLRYPWGNDITHEDANFGNEAGRDQWRYTAPAGSFPPNSFGLHDMIGNVWEWCADWHDGNYYRKSPAADPPGPAQGKERVVRGGGWGFHPKWLRASTRVLAKPGARGDDIGIRCVRDEAP